jgi:putative phosphoribosyl transferase
MFINRTDAGEQLVRVLSGYKKQPVVVYALPRGGVVLGVEIARFLEAPLDLIVVRKIGHPLQPEYAIGAIAEDGYVVMNRRETDSLDAAWLNRETAAELKEAQRRRALFLDGHAPIPVDGKVAIIVDDGLATGLTMQAAIHQIRQHGPKKIVVAVPVAASETIEKLRREVDEIVVLYIPNWFAAIGCFYRDFDQVSDQQVIALMNSVNDALVH